MPFHRWAVVALVGLACTGLVSGFSSPGATNMSYVKLTPSTSVVPPRRWNPCLVYSGPATNQLYMYGGRDVSEYGDIWRFDLATRVWTELTSLSTAQPDARWTPVCGYDTQRQRVIMSTGQNSKANYNDIWAFDVATNQWSELVPSTDSKPAIRYGSIGGYSETLDKFYVAQGFASGRFDDTWEFDLKTNVWKDITPGGRKPHARCLHAGTVTGDDKLVIFGGCGSGGYGPCPADDSWSMQLTADGGRSWGITDKCPAAAKYPAMAPAPGNARKNTHIILYGGSTEDDSGRLAILDVAAGTWTRFSPSTDVFSGERPLGRQGTAMAWAGNYGTVFFGGKLNSGVTSDDMWAITGDGTEEQVLSGCLNKFSLFAIHGILMFIGWGFFLQIGAIIARFGKKWDPAWFQAHRGLQVLGLLITIAGIVVAAIAQKEVGPLKLIPHHIIGIVIMLLGIFQPINAFFRPHKKKGEPLSTKRRNWQWLHWFTGRIALLLVIPQIFLGFKAIAAVTALYIAFGVWVGLLFIFYVVMYFMPNHGMYKPVDTQTSESTELESMGRQGSSTTTNTTSTATYSEQES